MTSTSELPRRAEQAVLGSVLARGSMPAGSLSAGDFADPVHQAIYAALATEPASRGPFTRLRDWLASLFSRQARDARSYLEDLPALCPDPGHGDSYAGMVTEAAAERMAALQARQAALQAQRPSPQALPMRATPRTPDNSQNGQAISQRDDPGRRALPQDGDPRDKLAAAGDYLAIPDAGQRRTIAQAASKEASAVLSALDPQVARLARALRPAIRSITSQATAAAGPDAVAPAQAPETTTKRDADRTWLQEQLLTALLRHPGQASAIARKLPDAAFTAGPHREIWQMISQHVADGKPFDPLILAGAASRQDHHQADAGEPAAAMTLRLAAQEATPGTVSTLARAVYADHLCTTRLGANWNKAPQQAGTREEHAGAARGPKAGQAPAPAATAAGYPAPQQAPAGPSNQGHSPQPTPARTRTPAQEHAPSPSSTPVGRPSRKQRPAASAGQQLQVPRPPEPGPVGPAPVQRR